MNEIIIVPGYGLRVLGALLSGTRSHRAHCRLARLEQQDRDLSKMDVEPPTEYFEVQTCSAAQDRIVLCDDFSGPGHRHECKSRSETWPR